VQSNSYDSNLIAQEFVGEIMDIKADSSVLNNKGLPDVAKIKPFLFDPANHTYYSLGGFLGQAFSTGKSARLLDSVSRIL
jgi:hypothetical protein